MNWIKLSRETFNSIVASLGLAVAVVTAWYQFYPSIYPSTHTVAVVSATQWSVADGRLGKGPALLVRISLSNLGNEAITVRGMNVKYALGSGDKKDLNCSSKNYAWAGVPWDEILRGETLTEAIAINVVPSIPVTEVVYFESSDLLSDNEKDSNGIGSMFACLEIDTLNTKLKRISVQHPIGTITYSDNSIVNFRMDDNARESFIVRQ